MNRPDLDDLDALSDGEAYAHLGDEIRGDMALHALPQVVAYTRQLEARLVRQQPVIEAARAQARIYRHLTHGGRSTSWETATLDTEKAVRILDGEAP